MIGFASVSVPIATERSIGPGCVTPRVCVEHATELERMTIRRVVVHGRLIDQPRKRRADDIRLSGMEIAARRVHPQRPPRRPGTLPRGEPQRVPQDVAEGKSAQGFDGRLECAHLVECRGARRVLVGWYLGGRVEREQLRAGKPAKRPRLRRPIEVPHRSRKRMEVMLGPVVIAAHSCERCLTGFDLLELGGQ